MNKELRKKNIKLYYKKAAPLEHNFDLHEHVKTNEKYISALKVRLKRFPDKVYVISYSQMYKEHDPWEMEKEAEFVKLIKEFFHNLPDKEFIDEINPTLENFGDLDKFIQYAKQKDFSFNEEYLHEVITDPKNSTLIIRNSPSESAPREVFGKGPFQLSSFYFVHDVFCHGKIESHEKLNNKIKDIIFEYVLECSKNYIYEDKSFADYILEKKKHSLNSINNLIKKKVKIIDDEISRTDNYNKILKLEDQKDRLISGTDLEIDLDDKELFQDIMMEYFDLQITRYSDGKSITENSLYDETGNSLFAKEFVKNIIRFPRVSGEDDLFCDFISAMYSKKLNFIFRHDKHIHKEHKFSYTKEGGMKRYVEKITFSPNSKIESVTSNCINQIKEVINSTETRDLYKNKVIYHPFYNE